MKRRSKAGKKWINGTRGVISLFLAILMVPFVSIGGALLNAARGNSAVAVFDEALCNASNSTLGTYDGFLRSRFGLLAMSQDTSSRGGGYTAQDLISETFQYYMEQNVGALSNTYVTAQTDAAGIYPLADTGVLLSQVLEYSKYTVPARLVIDGFCIDDIIGNLLPKMEMTKSLLGTMTAGTDMAQKLDACDEKFDSAGEKLKACETALGEYSSAYSAFDAAVREYNRLVDERAAKISECQGTISDTNADIEGYNETIDEEEEKYPGLCAQWSALKNEKDAYGNPVDNSEAMEELEEEHEELKTYVEAQEGLEEAEENLEEAEENLEAVIAQYQTKLDNQRTAVSNSKISYSGKISTLASSLKSAGEAVVAAQEAQNDLDSAGVDLAVNIAGNIQTGQNKSMDTQIKDMEAGKKAALERGDSEAAYLWSNQIDEANAKKNNLSDMNTILVTGTTSGVNAGRDSMKDFAVNDYISSFNTQYTKLIQLKGKVDGYTLANGYETKMPGTGGYYDNGVMIPVTSGDLERLQEGLAEDTAESSFFATVKALIGFIKAMVSFSAWVDLELTGTINTSLYSGIGGLPSSKNRSEGSAYCLKSSYDTEDSQRSDYYKQLLSSYSTGSFVPGNGTGADSLIDQILNDLSDLSESLEDWHWYNVFKKTKALYNAVTGLVGHVLEFAKNAAVILAEAVGQKLLLAGYVAYNIPNRTTYGSYSLPRAGSPGQGYAFYGAETEYIMKGSLSEAVNQTKVFNNVWLIRLAFDFGFVLTNAEVASIAGEAGAVTFGIGTIVVYILYMVAEPFVDTLVLVNGGKVPIWKSTLYLTPSGITDLIGVFYHLTLSDAQKNTAYKQVVKVMSIGKASDSYAQNYADAYQSGISDPDAGGSSKVVSSLTFDYTKTLLMAMLFENKETMLNRLADIIQMEASYNAATNIGTYTFNLDESYTYLRSSGSFTTNEFLPISDSAGLRSKERIIYRGY